jgi:hypothetical protein
MHCRERPGPEGPAGQAMAFHILRLTPHEDHPESPGKALEQAERGK